MKLNWRKYTLQFKNASGTSRGVLKTKDSYFLEISHSDKTGIGECGLLRGLSVDDRDDYEDRLDQLSKDIQNSSYEELYGSLIEFPSIQSGLEMAILDLNSENHILFPSDFTSAKSLQPINGLIWMGDESFMKDQLKKRLSEGFNVLKMKIGAIDLEEEFTILESIRKQYTLEELEIRVDANGAFSPKEAKEVLESLSKLDIHSIEQPIKKGQWQEMAELCQHTKVPIALDEELIGVFSIQEKEDLLHTIKPQYIILKPSFIGGFKGSEEWIDLANKQNCGWWVTSALESNIGLSAIAQWNYTLNNPLPSGLGTGSLYTNNIESPLFVEKGSIGYNSQKKWEINL